VICPSRQNTSAQPLAKYAVGLAAVRRVRSWSRAYAARGSGQYPDGGGCARESEPPGGAWGCRTDSARPARPQEAAGAVEALALPFQRRLAESSCVRTLAAYGLKSVSIAAPADPGNERSSAGKRATADPQSRRQHYNPRRGITRRPTACSADPGRIHRERRLDCGSRHYRECCPNLLAPAICST
jgi:hypothetical protein